MDKKMMTIDLNSKVLLDKAERDGVETMYDRKQNFKAQCGFGLQGNCCRICVIKGSNLIFNNIIILRINRRSSR